MTPEELEEIRRRDKPWDLIGPTDNIFGRALRDRRALLEEVDRLKKSITVTDRGLHIIVEEQHRDVAELRAEVDRLTAKLADAFDEGAAAMRAELRDTDGSGWPSDLYREPAPEPQGDPVYGRESRPIAPWETQ